MCTLADNFIVSYFNKTMNHRRVFSDQALVQWRSKMTWNVLNIISSVRVKIIVLYAERKVALLATLLIQIVVTFIAECMTIFSFFYRTSKREVIYFQMNHHTYECISSVVNVKFITISENVIFRLEIRIHRKQSDWYLFLAGAEEIN